MRIAVIGVGGSGGAALRYLAEAGHTVVGYERFAVGHARGSSHGESRIIRYTYPDALYTRLMGLAYPLWDALEAAAGEELFVRCGSVFVGPPDHPTMASTAAALDANGVAYTWLDRDAAAETFPAFALEGGEALLWQRDGGFLRAGSVVRANVRLAHAAGATVRENTVVTRLAPRGAETIVTTADGARDAYDRVIVTAGAWVGALFPELRLPLTVTRQQVTYLSVHGDSEVFSPERMPVWIDATTDWYGFPSDGRVAGIKLAHHYPHTPVDPDVDPRQPSEADVDAALACAARRLPGLGTPAVRAQVCLYTNTPTEDFLVDAHPQMPGVLIVSGCSGHGFKFTTLLGRLAADWALGVPWPLDLSRFSLSPR